MLLSDFTSQYLVIHEKDEVARVQFKDDRLTDEANIEQIGRELFALTDQYHCQKVILDLTGLKMLTSSVLGKMITLHRKLHRGDGKLVLCNAGEYVTKILEASRLDDYFNLAKDQSAALKLLP
ncbi:MAG: STAS domain-containing protein [Planctomycetaceae bacterium]|jgi:anti-sigma B factor antagonist|nr:STAS domain-containing protein [Planctomycetaceae bacterium]